jgi:alpha-beta hydrolase superfamily lysophospholipase
MRFQSLVLAFAVSGFVDVAAAEPGTTTPDGATAAAPAISTAAPAAAPVQAVSADADKVVCHVGPAPTGSRLGSTRECHTQREWDRMRQEQSNMVSGRQNVLGCGPSGCGH